MNKFKWDWLMIITNILLLILLIFTIRYTTELRNEGALCRINPLVYGAGLYEKASGSPFQGTGSFLDIKYSSFTFTKDGIKSQLASSNLPYVNFTLPSLNGVLR